MNLNRISDRVWHLTPEDKTDRPVLGYVKGDRYSLAIDAGNSPDHVRQFYARLRRAGLRLPDFTVITHWHWDHTCGMCSVHGCTVTCSRTNAKLQEVQQWEWTGEAMERRLRSGEEIQMCDQCIKLEYPDRTTIKSCQGIHGVFGRCSR